MDEPQGPHSDLCDTGETQRGTFLDTLSPMPVLIYGRPIYANVVWLDGTSFCTHA